MTSSESATQKSKSPWTVTAILEVAAEMREIRCFFFFISRLPEFKSFEELELPKHSKVKRQSSASNSPELEQQPDVTMAEWKSRPTHEILQKLQVSTTRPPVAPSEVAGRGLAGAAALPLRPLRRWQGGRRCVRTEALAEAVPAGWGQGQGLGGALGTSGVVLDAKAPSGPPRKPCQWRWPWSP